MEEGTIVPLILEGDEQIVLIPDPFRFDTPHVRIWREGVRVVIEPLRKRPRPARRLGAIRRARPATR